jgi:hypothetical protein
MNRLSRILNEDPGESDFTAYDRYLERVLFKGDYDEPAEARAIASSSQ